MNERSERIWGWPFWIGTILGLIATSRFCHHAMFVDNSIKSMLGSFLVALVPAIFTGVIFQIVWSLVKGTVAGDFGVAAYAMIIVVLGVTVSVGLLFSRLSDRWQERIGILADVLICAAILLGLITQRRMPCERKE